MRRSRIGLPTIAAGVLTLLVHPPTHAGVNVWTPNSPPGGFAITVRYARTDPQRLYAIVGHKLFRSRDDGRTWTPTSLSVSPGTNLIDLAIDPTNADVLYVAADDAGFRRSTNGGDTFTTVAPGGLTRRAFAVGLSDDGSAVYLAYLDGQLVSSTDGGNTWTSAPALVPDSAGGVNSVAVASGTDTVVYVVRSLSGVYKSMDGGGSWEHASPTSNGFFCVVAFPGSTNTMLVGSFDGLHLTTDGGANWALQSSVPPAVTEIHVDPRPTPTSALRLFVQANQDVFLSTSGTDGPWTSITDSLPGQPNSLSLHPTNSARIFVATWAGLQATNDGGATWQASQDGIAETRANALHAARDGSDRLYLGTPHSGVFATSGNAQQWLATNAAGLRSAAGTRHAPLVLSIATEPRNANSLYMSLNNEGVVHSSDGGSIWAKIAAADDRLRSANAIAVDHEDARIVYAATFSGSVLKSVNGGDTWTRADTGLECPGQTGNPNISSLALDPSDSQVLFAVGRCGNGSTGFGVFRTDNGGMSWARTGSGVDDLPGNAITVEPTDNRLLYFSAASNGLYRSADGGVSWQLLPSPPGGWGATFQVAIDPLVPSTLYVAGFGIYRSVDRGASWEPLHGTQPGPAGNVQHVALDPLRPHIVYVSDFLSGLHVLEIAPDLRVTIEGHSGDRPVGAAAQLVITARNAGKWAANAVRLSATLGSGFPAATATPDRGTCSLNGTGLACEPLVLRAGESQRVTVRYTPGSTGTLAVTASVDGYEPDSDASNNAAQASAIAVVAPLPASGGGGGGGVLGSLCLMLLAWIAAASTLARSRRG